MSETVTEMAAELDQDTSWRTKTYLIGGLAGLLIGLGTAFLLVRSSDERSGGPPEVSTMDALKVGVAVIGLVRGIAALGD